MPTHDKPWRLTIGDQHWDPAPAVKHAPPVSRYTATWIDFYQAKSTGLHAWAVFGLPMTVSARCDHFQRMGWRNVEIRWCHNTQGYYGYDGGSCCYLPPDEHQEIVINGDTVLTLRGVRENLL